MTDELETTNDCYIKAQTKSICYHPKRAAGFMLRNVTRITSTSLNRCGCWGADVLPLKMDGVHLVYVFQESNTHRTPKQKLCRLDGSAEWCKSFLAMKIRKHRHHSQIQYWIMNIVILYNLKTWLQQETSREPLRQVNVSLTVSLGIFFQVSIFGITADVRAQS